MATILPCFLETKTICVSPFLPLSDSVMNVAVARGKPLLSFLLKNYVLGANDIERDKPLIRSNRLDLSAKFLNTR